MMNIVFFGSFSFNEGGGVGRVSRSLASEFTRQGHRCFFLAAKPGEQCTVEGVSQCFLLNSKVNSRDNQQYIKRFISDKQIDVIINQSGFNIHAFRLLESVIDECTVITVHHNCVACLQDQHHSIIRHSLARLQVPLWALPDWLMDLLKARSRRKTGRCIERIASTGDGIVLLADSFISELSVFTNRIDHDRVLAIPNPCPFTPDVNALVDKRKSILYVGRLENGQKRVDRLLDIWSRLTRRFPAWHLDIVGDGPDANVLKQQAKSMGLERIKFHGKCDPLPFYRSASLLLLPSDFEGFGMVLVEAQAFGCIPVAGDCFSAIDSVIRDGASGFIVEKGNIEAYCEKASILMQDAGRLAIMQKAALDQVLRYQPEFICRQWLELFEVIGQRKRRSTEKLQVKNSSAIL